MATSIYKKIGFEDRQDTKPDTYLVDGVPKTIEKDNSGLVQAGTNLNQENLDHMEEGILQNSRNINELDKKIGNHAELIEKNTSQLDDMVIKQDENTKQIEQNKNELNNKMDKTGGEFTGITRAYSNTSYSVAQVRNIILSNKDADVSLLKDGEIWIKYK